MMRVGERVTGRERQRGAILLAFTDVTTRAWPSSAAAIDQGDHLPGAAVPRVPTARVAETRPRPRKAPPS